MHAFRRVMRAILEAGKIFRIGAFLLPRQLALADVSFAALTPRCRHTQRRSGYMEPMEDRSWKIPICSRVDASEFFLYRPG